jgi:uncharacterized protein
VKLSLSHTIAADRERVFDALVDPAVIQRCIPGCESLVSAGPDIYDATLKIGVAGLKGTYAGRTTITNRRSPESLSIAVEGKGAPGFVRGAAEIALLAEGGGTKIDCQADVQVGGLIAAVGSRLIDAVARKMAAEFFDRLDRQLAAT